MTRPFPLLDFLAGRLPPDDFHHREHLQAAFELLRRHDFAEAVQAYVRALRSIASAAGHPEKFHMTITVAMLSAIAERSGSQAADFDSFAARHAEVFDREFLLQHYSKERLQCDLARTTFLLPDPNAR